MEENENCKENKEKVVVYGEIKISWEEKEILSYPPDHALHPYLNVEKIETEVDKAVVKYTWDKNQREHEAECAEVIEELGDENDVSENADTGTGSVSRS